VERLSKSAEPSRPREEQETERGEVAKFIESSLVKRRAACEGIQSEIKCSAYSIAN